MTIRDAVARTAAIAPALAQLAELLEHLAGQVSYSINSHGYTDNDLALLVHGTDAERDADRIVVSIPAAFTHTAVPTAADPGVVFHNWRATWMGLQVEVCWQELTAEVAAEDAER